MCVSSLLESPAAPARPAPSALKFPARWLAPLGAAALAGVAPATFAAGPGVPTNINKIVVVIEENRSYVDVIQPNTAVPPSGTPAPYINTLARAGASFTNATEVVTSPSQPNYLALFSGSAQGVTDNNVHPRFAAANLGSQLINSGRTFIGYSQNMFADGFDGATSSATDAAAAGPYARKHNPMTQFTDLAPGGNNSAVNKVFNASNFPTGASDYSFLPTVSFVVPDLNNDMHDGSVATGDAWLQSNLGAYASWAQGHNSLLIVTWDEGNTTSGDVRVPLVFYGPMVTPGQYGEAVNNYNLLRTIEDAYGLSPLANAASAAPITSVWAVPEPTGLCWALGAAGLCVRRRRVAGTRPR